MSCTALAQGKRTAEVIILVPQALPGAALPIAEAGAAQWTCTDNKVRFMIATMTHAL